MAYKYADVNGVAEPFVNFTPNKKATVAQTANQLANPHIDTWNCKHGHRRPMTKDFTEFVQSDVGMGVR